MQHPPKPIRHTRLSIVIPCYNEERTLKKCVERVLSIADANLSLEVIIVDDRSVDKSASIASELERKHPEIRVLKHEKNQGKGAALRTGFESATGDFVCVQDADLEYDPHDIKRLLRPLVCGKADVVLGSRFLSSGEHRVLYFWHYVANRTLTLLSNMFTDLNLTDMETCYKVFRRDVLQDITIQEDRFGFEPEIVAKIAHKRLRIYEMGISYYGRTYEEGKKIGLKDGFRALFCILHYNLHLAPVPIQLLAYLFIGGFCAVINLFAFLTLIAFDFSAAASALIAFFFAAAVNYILCILLLFRHKARWNTKKEIAVYIVIVCLIGLIDVESTRIFMMGGMQPWLAKSVATLIGLLLNFLGRRYFVFPEKPSGPWKSQHDLDAPHAGLEG